MTTSNWIALAAVATSLFTPLALAILGFSLNKRLKHFECALDAQRRTSDTRFELYKDIGFKLNDIFAYFIFVGRWKSHSVSEMVDRKRDLDTHVFTYRPLFSDGFGSLYDRFMSECFRPFGGMGKDARLRTTCQHRQEQGDISKADCFTEENNTQAIRAAYSRLMSSLAAEVGLQPERREQ